MVDIRNSLVYEMNCYYLASIYKDFEKEYNLTENRNKRLDVFLKYYEKWIDEIGSDRELIDFYQI